MGMHGLAVRHSCVLRAMGTRPKRIINGMIKTIRGLLAYSLRLASISRKLMRRTVCPT